MREPIMLPPTVMLSRQSSYEDKAVLTVCNIQDIAIIRADLQELQGHERALQSGTVMPVGSVEYLRAAMTLAGHKEPANLSYHDCIRPYLGRRVYPWLVGDLKTVAIPRPVFVKPAHTKLFTGFVLVPGQPAEQYPDSSRDCFTSYMSMPDTEELWTSANCPFLCEWRYYINNGVVIGASRYDTHGAKNAPRPNPLVVQAAIQAAWQHLKHAFALDMGIYGHNNKTAVVELNDAWAIGLYRESETAPTPLAYTKLLWSRWQGMFA